VSSDGQGRSAAISRSAQVRGERAVTGASDGVAAPASVVGEEPPTEVLEFIRYCYRRRGYGWPELYDEMCAAAARGSYRGMDYDQLAALGIGFSLGELPRLAALAQRVVTEERRARADGRGGMACGDVTRTGEGTVASAARLVATPAV
jgi:hypothetical protein